MRAEKHGIQGKRGAQKLGLVDRARARARACTAPPPASPPPPHHDGHVNQVLQALGACLIQPRILLLPPLLTRERGRVGHLRGKGGTRSVSGSGGAQTGVASPANGCACSLLSIYMPSPLKGYAITPPPQLPPSSLPQPLTSARTWSKMGSSTLSNIRFQNESAKTPPWHLSVSKSTSRALLRISGLCGGMCEHKCGYLGQAGSDTHTCYCPHFPTPGVERELRQPR